MNAFNNTKLRLDQIGVFMILYGYHNIDRNTFVSVKEYRRHIE